MITASDSTSLQQRGKYNGFIGAAVALGSGSGPLIGGAITSHLSWRWAQVSPTSYTYATYMNSLWYDVPWLGCLAGLLYATMPDNPAGGSVRTKVRLVDWAGLLVGVSAIVLLVVRSVNDRTIYLQLMLSRFHFLVEALQFHGAAPR